MKNLKHRLRNLGRSSVSPPTPSFYDEPHVLRPNFAAVHANLIEDFIQVMLKGNTRFPQDFVETSPIYKHLSYNTKFQVLSYIPPFTLPLACLPRKLLTTSRSSSDLHQQATRIRPRTRKLRPKLQRQVDTD